MNSTAIDLSSSATNPLEIDLLGSGRLPALPSAWLRGDDRDLLRPLNFLVPDEPLPDPMPAKDRRALADALAVANAAYGHPAAEAMAERLADPETQVVVTGQQAGLWGGPLLGLSKLLATLRWVEALEAAGRKAVAVFWVATEDHDFRETAQTVLLGRDGVENLSLGDDPAPLMPVGMRTFGPNLDALDAQAAELLSGTAPGLAWVQRWYRPNARFGEAFSRLMVSLLGERAPLMLDSMLPEVKRQEQPWMRRLVEERGAVDSTFQAREAEIVDRGYELQVAPQPNTSPLFLLRGNERRRIAWTDDGTGYFLRGLEDDVRPVDELLTILDENPSVVSPGVLARPAMQDAMLGTAIQVLGPSETTYMSQVSAIYPLLGLDPPSSALRPQLMVLEARQVEYLNELGVTLPELLGGDIDKLLTEKLGGDIVQPIRERIEAALEDLHGPVVGLDQSLEKPLRKTRDHMIRGLDQLAGRVAAATARKNDTWKRRLEQIHQSVEPKGFQERTLPVLHFLNRFGPEVGHAILAQLDLDPRCLRALQLDPAPGNWGDL